MEETVHPPVNSYHSTGKHEQSKDHFSEEGQSRTNSLNYAGDQNNVLEADKLSKSSHINHATHEEVSQGGQEIIVQSSDRLDKLSFEEDEKVGKAVTDQELARINDEINCPLEDNIAAKAQQASLQEDSQVLKLLHPIEQSDLAKEILIQEILLLQEQFIHQTFTSQELEIQNNNLVDEINGFYDAIEELSQQLKGLDLPLLPQECINRELN